MENETGKKIEDLVNSTLFDGYNVAKHLSNMHRYLQQEFMKMVLHFFCMLAENYENGRYDGRNEYACKVAKKTIDFWKESDDLNLKVIDSTYKRLKERDNNKF